MTDNEMKVIRRRCKRDHLFWTSLHEAAHAVFALRLELPFERVFVFDFTREIPFVPADEINEAIAESVDFEDAEGGLVVSQYRTRTKITLWWL